MSAARTWCVDTLWPNVLEGRWVELRTRYGREGSACAVALCELRFAQRCRKTDVRVRIRNIVSGEIYEVVAR